MLLKLVDELLSGRRLDLLVVVTGEEGPAVDFVVSQEKIIDADQFVRRCLVGSGEDVQPGLHRISSVSWGDEHWPNIPITAQIPSFSRMWSEPVPKDSSPQMERRPASIRLPKNFQPKSRFNIPLHLVGGGSYQ